MSNNVNGGSEKGQNTEFRIPVEGSLGLLALGAVGLKAWREVRRKARKNLKGRPKKTKK